MDKQGYVFAPFLTSDLEAIAALHALSWQRHYRNILPDPYLDNEVHQERLELWTRRFQKMSPKMHVITLKKAGELVGFSGVFLDDHPEYGAYIDNLHVLAEHQGMGLGHELMRQTAQWVQEKNSESGMYLHVFDENFTATKFYEQIGGKLEETKDVEAPGGAVRPIRIYSWQDIPAFLSA